MATTDFDKMWIQKLSDSLEKTASARTREEVLRGSEGLSSSSSRDDVIRWTQCAMRKMQDLLSQRQQIQTMTACACQYPLSQLKEIRRTYEQSKDVVAAHDMLQQQFVSFLRNSLGLDDAQVNLVVTRGWGLAGILDGNRIVATKIPKSGNLKAYLAETSEDAQRQYYCHCPRVREAVSTGETIPPLYCYCGAGYYRGIWEEILQRPVRVTLLKSVLLGDDVCQFELDLGTTEEESGHA